MRKMPPIRALVGNTAAHHKIYENGNYIAKNTNLKEMNCFV